MALHSINGLSLCAGIGSLDLGVELALPAYRVAVHVEREIFAAAILAARMQDGSIPEALIWSDLATFNGKPWRGRIQIITAGLPCQPYSVAGKQLGHDDERAIWPEGIRIVDEVRPAVVWLENVPNFLQFFREPGEALSAMGYRIEAGLFSASEVGAPHRRERLFILAYDHQQGRGILKLGELFNRERATFGYDADRLHSELADPRRAALWESAERECETVGRGQHADFVLGELADSQNDQRRRGDRGAQTGIGQDGERGRGLASGGGDVVGPRNRCGCWSPDAWDRKYGMRPGEVCVNAGALADTAESGLEERSGEGRNPWQERTPAERDRSNLALFPPGPGDVDRWRAILEEHPELAPAIECELRDLAARAPAGVGGLRAPRLDQLRALGNSVVSITAALAFVTLARKLGIKEGGIPT